MLEHFLNYLSSFLLGEHNKKAPCGAFLFTYFQTYLIVTFV